MPKTLNDLAGDIAAATGNKAAEQPAPDVGEPTRDQMLQKLAEHYATTPDEVAKMLRVDQGIIARPAAPTDGPLDRPLPEGTQLFPVELTADYWAGKQIMDQWPIPPEFGGQGDNRCVAGKMIRLPMDEAMRLIEEGKAKRADRMSPA